MAIHGLLSGSNRQYNGCHGIVIDWDAHSASWILKLTLLPDGDAPIQGEPVRVSPLNLIPLRAHETTVEPATEAESRSVLSATFAQKAATGGVCSCFGDAVQLPADLVLLQIFSLLSRCTISGHGRWKMVSAGTLEVASEVNHEWRGMCLALRAMTPACAKDVAVKLRLQGSPAAASADGEHRVWHLGDRTKAPMLLYIHNALAPRPTEFISLAAGSGTNFSFFPPGGAANGSAVMTHFAKLRVCPWTLLVKTDDYTFATSVGRVVQIYWNGKRRLELDSVPFATARDAATHFPVGASPNRGQAQIDLRDTGFGVRIDGFCAVGCAASGRIALPTDCCDDPTALVQQRVALYGGGFAGRMTPVDDRTLDDMAIGGDHDDEGRNGGWVLPLVRMSEAALFGHGLMNTIQAMCPVAKEEAAGGAMESLQSHMERTEMYLINWIEDLGNES